MLNDQTVMEQLSKYYTVWLETNYVYEEWAKAHGLSVNSLFVLSTIQEIENDCTQKKISQRMMIPKQTTNMILKDFVRKGYVELLPMSGDKRNKVIRFTEAGKKYADAILSELRKVELTAIEELGIERMKQMNDNTALFIELFRKAGEKNGHETDL